MHSAINTKNNTFKGFLYSLTATALLSTNYITAKYALEGFNPETFSFFWTLAATVYSIIILISNKEIKKIVIPSNYINPILLLGSFTGIGMILGWSGLALLDPSFASFLGRFRPVITIILGFIFLHERFMKKELFPIAMVFAGAFISAVGRWDKIGTGMILILLSACAAAVQMLIAKMTINDNKIPTNILVFYRVFIAFLIIAVWNLLTGKMNLHVKTSYYLVTFSGAFLGPCLSWIFMFRSYIYWDLARSSILYMAQPLFVLPMAYFILKRFPEHKEIYGGCLILIGALLLGCIQYASTKNIRSR